MARPHSPDTVDPVREEAGRYVEQVAIGSCTNSSLDDMLKVGAILAGQVVPPGLSLVISPGSRQILSAVTRNGTLGEIIASGARILECACGPCIGRGQPDIRGRDG